MLSVIGVSSIEILADIEKQIENNMGRNKGFIQGTLSAFALTE
jgi:hypothetical protein